MERATEMIDAYNHMAEERVTEKLVDRILKSRLPAKVLPGYIKEEEIPGVRRRTLS